MYLFLRRSKHHKYFLMTLLIEMNMYGSRLRCARLRYIISWLHLLQSFKPLSNSISSLCDLFGQIGGYTHLLICGDFNLKDITWHDYCRSCNNHNIEPFLEKVDELFLFQHVTKLTRYRSSDTPSLLDLVFTN